MFSLFDEINWRARGLLSPSIDTSDSLAWKTFPFNPVTSQKTLYKGTNAKEKKNIPTTAPIKSFNVLFLPCT